MNRDSSSHRGGFPSTHWSIIARTSGPDARDVQDALARLLQRYYSALLVHLRYRFAGRVGVHESKDLLQGFVADKVLARRLFAQADPQRGRFRALILTALDRYTYDWLRQNKREFGDIDAIAEPLRQDESPDVGFETAWAREILGRAIERMRTECDADHPLRWAVFNARVLVPALEDAQPVPFAQLVEQYGFVSPVQAGNTLTTAKRMFVRILRDIVGEYAADESEIDEELADLQRILTSGGA
ncbi:MAG: sigma-70 family RNA polymerase sigma factor [Phycisphaerae bacterium]|nr:sigma-70 family RNA polymerase sigma factor [Phycisphaerae bacterium]